MYLLSIFPFLRGANELHIVFMLNIVLLGLMFYKVHKNKKFIFTKDIKFIAICIWAISYLLTAFWSADTELSVLGFFKFFTVPIFILTIMQYEYTKEERDKWFEAISKIGAIMVVLCIFFILIGKHDVFFYQNRLAGFFNYANSFAMFLLVGFIITGFKKDFKIIDFIVMNLLLIGIILTNSRSIMIITAFSFIITLIFSKLDKKTKSIITGSILITGVITVYIVGTFGVSNRLSEVSGNSSEWLLRILYYKDAIRMLKDNIFGYGYMAWWYMQEGLQTGAYDAQYIHNGLLQVAVDAGVIPALLVVIIFIKAFFEKNREIRDKVLMVIILGHALIDFDMEFMAIMLPLFMTLEFDKKFEIRSVKITNMALSIVFISYSFFALVVTCNKFQKYDISNSLFEYSIALNDELELESDIIKVLDISEKLYKKNKYYLNSAKVLSQREQSINNYEKAYEYELWIVQNKKYTMRNYIEFVSFLQDAIKYYYSIGDMENVKLFISRLIEVENMVQTVKDTSDELAYKIAHKPRLDMPEEMQKYIREMREFSEGI